MRLLAGILLLAVLSRTAAADEVHPVKSLSAGLYFSGYGGGLNGVGESGMGPTAEVSFGSGRAHYFLEAGVAWMNLRALEPRESGFMTRGGLGARWIARSFDFDDEGAVEMAVDAVIGARKTWWESGGALVRPDISFGVGIQMRKFRKPHAAVRFHIRAYFAPADDDATVTARCTGDCPSSSSSFTDSGMMFSIGGWL